MRTAADPFRLSPHARNSSPDFIHAASPLCAAFAAPNRRPDAPIELAVASATSPAFPRAKTEPRRPFLAKSGGPAARPSSQQR